MAKEICFGYGKFTFTRVDDETLSLKSRKDLSKKVQMRLKIVAETSNVVDVYFDIVDVAKDLFHDFLRDVGRLRDTHWKAIVAIKTKGGCDGAEVFTCVVEFECVVLHGNVQFG